MIHVKEGDRAPWDHEKPIYALAQSRTRETKAQRGGAPAKRRRPNTLCDGELQPMVRDRKMAGEAAFKATARSESNAAAPWAAKGSGREVVMGGVLVFLAVLVWWGASPAYADSRIGVDGTTLYGWCRTTAGGLPSEPVAGYCAGFINGVVDVHGEKTTVYGHRACLPLSVTIRELRTIVVKWLEDHPGEWRLVAHGLVGRALSEAFPCR